MDDLLALDSKLRLAAEALPTPLASAHSPLQIHRWEEALQDHPDAEFKSYLLRGFSGGFRIGFDEAKVSLRPAKSNMASAGEHPQVISSYLLEECEKGRVIGPVDSTTEKLVRQVSRFGVIPKGHTPGKWRLIVDLSAPEGHSVNDGIDPGLCLLEYTSVDQAARVVSSLGRRCSLAKIDVKSAYRIIPVHPKDALLLGMRWQGGVYVDKALPFGLRSAPKIFNAVADGLAWILQNSGVRLVLHYLDDFLIFGPPCSDECQQALATTLRICSDLGVPVADEKVEGPVTRLTFLGIEMDTDRWELRLPREKLHRIRSLVVSWRSKKACTKRELLSLIGQLQHACRVVRAGRSFLRRMINLSSVAREPHHHIRLSVCARSDVEWWATFLPHWNGVSLMGSDIHAPPRLVVTSDASGSWGCGAFTCSGKWFQLPWPEAWGGVHITCKELLPVVLACAVWGRGAEGGTVRCRTDNAAVVSIVNAGRSKDTLAMHLMRCLSFFMARFAFVVRAEHVPGRDNGAADALSCDRLTSFRSQVSGAASRATDLPVELLDMLVHSRPDWTSQLWSSQFSAILQKV